MAENTYESDRNVTVDNWFSRINIVEEIEEKKLSYVDPFEQKTIFLIYMSRRINKKVCLFQMNTKLNVKMYMFITLLD